MSSTIQRQYEIQLEKNQDILREYASWALGFIFSFIATYLCVLLVIVININFNEYSVLTGDLSLAVSISITHFLFSNVVVFFVQIGLGWLLLLRLSKYLAKKVGYFTILIFNALWLALVFVATVLLISISFNPDPIDQVIRTFHSTSIFIVVGIHIAISRELSLIIRQDDLSRKFGKSCLSVVVITLIQSSFNFNFILIKSILLLMAFNRLRCKSE